MGSTFKYTLLTLIRNGGIMIWALAFPIILATMFYVMFANMDFDQYGRDIEVIVVDNEAWQSDENLQLREMVSSFTEPGTAGDGESAMMVVTYVGNEAEALEALYSTPAVAVLSVGNDDFEPMLAMKLDPAESSALTIRQTVVKTALESSVRIETAVTDSLEALFAQLPAEVQAAFSDQDLLNLSEQEIRERIASILEGSEAPSLVTEVGAPPNKQSSAGNMQSLEGTTDTTPANEEADAPSAIEPGSIDAIYPIIDEISEIAEDTANRVESLASADFIDRVSVTRNEPSVDARYYYALMGMAALMAGNVGMVAMVNLLPYVSAQGARRSLGAASRRKLVLSSFFAAWLITCLCLMIAYGYIRVVLSVDFGDQDGPALLVIIVASLMATSLGTFFGAIPRLPPAAKSGILTGVACIASLFAGLYGTACMELADTIANQAPVLALINPARQISQAFYALYYYDSYSPYGISLFVLLATTVVLLIGTYVLSGKQKYAHL